MAKKSRKKGHRRITKASLAGLGSPPAVHRTDARGHFNAAYTSADTAIYWAKTGHCHDAVLSLLSAFQARGAGMEAARAGRLTKKKMRAEFAHSFGKVSEALDAVTGSACLVKTSAKDK